MQHQVVLGREDHRQLQGLNAELGPDMKEIVTTLIRWLAVGGPDQWHDRWREVRGQLRSAKTAERSLRRADEPTSDDAGHSAAGA